VDELRRLKTYQPPLSGRERGLRLDFNEWLGPPHPRLDELLRAFPLEKLSLYPEQGEALGKTARHFGVPESSLILCNGVDEGLCQVYRCFVGRGDKALVPDPGYAMMEFYLTLCGADIRPWILPAPDFDYPLEALDAFLEDGGRAVTIARPNNPTGSDLDKTSVLERVVAFPDCLFVVDEAYVEFSGDSLAEQVSAHPNLVVLRTFSKIWSLAALRLGALLCHEDVARPLRRMWSPYSVNGLGLYLLERLLPDPDWPRQVAREVAREKARLRDYFSRRGFQSHFGGGNFFLLKIEEGKTRRFREHFREAGVLLREQGGKRHLENFWRISIGPAPVTDRFLEVFEACFP
jgi:histidinol-phosphate aminotransferase